MAVVMATLAIFWCLNVSLPVKMHRTDAQSLRLFQGERTHGVQSGEVFVRLNRATLYEPQGTLDGARPFLQTLVQDDEVSCVQSSQVKVESSHKLRQQIQEQRRGVKKRWDAVRKVMQVYGIKSTSNTLERYLQRFERLEQAYKQYVTKEILYLETLLEAESLYIMAWHQREETKRKDERTLSKLLYHFTSFGLQLESETSGQVRMWRLPATNAQRMRCVKAATENMKKRYFSPSSRSFEVLEVYKIENRVLLNTFQQYTTSLAQTTSEIKIKGLFCSIPAESVERCVVYGMHTVPEGQHCFVDTHGVEVKIFNRSVLLQDCDETLGMSVAFQAQAKVNNATPLQFPRRFSRYSTLDDMQASFINSESDVQYLGLCRVAMSKTVRVTGTADEPFPEDPSVSALLFTNEEEYLVRYPEAVVPEFIVQVRVQTPTFPLPVSVSGVSLTSSVPNFAFSAFQDFIYSESFDSSSSATSAFPFALSSSDRNPGFRLPKEASINSCSVLSPASKPHDRVDYADEELVMPHETILANCAQQKLHLRQDLQRSERLFWTRAQELWKEEGRRGGIQLQLPDQPQSCQDETKAQQLRMRKHTRSPSACRRRLNK